MRGIEFITDHMVYNPAYKRQPPRTKFSLVSAKKVANRARSGFEGEKQHFLSNGIEIERLSFIQFLFNL